MSYSRNNFLYMKYNSQSNHFMATNLRGKAIKPDLSCQDNLPKSNMIVMDYNILKDTNNVTFVYVKDLFVIKKNDGIPNDDLALMIHNSSNNINQKSFVIVTEDDIIIKNTLSGHDVYVEIFVRYDNNLIMIDEFKICKPDKNFITLITSLMKCESQNYSLNKNDMSVFTSVKNITNINLRNKIKLYRHYITTEDFRSNKPPTLRVIK